IHAKAINCSFPSKTEVHWPRKQTAMVFQPHHLFAHKTVIENVMEGLTIARKMRKQDAYTVAENELRKVGLQDKLNAYPSQLSG
ncbi:hypothetical protein NG726_39225, partial [Pseudomonas sp. MOB-449]|nr:hypothetical protein [Pseudomonas sp. MOB-449]